MDVQGQDQTKHINPSGHEGGHVVHLCRRCGWPYPNPHPSAKHRRSHKKICGTIEGYTILIDSEPLSDDEHHLDDDKEKTPSPKIEKKSSVGDGGETVGRFSRSGEDLFADAVTEFSDSGVSSASSKTFDRDLFFSFKDDENGGSNELKLELPDQGRRSSAGLVKEGGLLKSQDAEPINIVNEGEEKVQETRIPGTKELDVPETVIEESKDLKVEASDTSKSTPEISACVGGYDENVDQKKVEKLSDVDNGENMELATTDAKIEEIEQKSKSDCENVPEVVKESESVHGVERIREEIAHETSGFEHEHAPEVAKESETDQKEVMKDPVEVMKDPEVDQGVAILTEKEVPGPPESENCSSEQVQEAFKEPDTVTAELKDLGAAELENCPKQNTQEVVEELGSILTEKEKDDIGSKKSEECSNEQAQDSFTTPDAILIENENLGAPNLEKSSNEHTQEAVKKPNTVLTEKMDLGAPNLEKVAKEQAPEVVEVPSLLNEHSHEVIKETKDDNNSEDHLKHDSGVVSEPIVETGTNKPITNQDPVADLSVDSSSRNSLEVNWGSVSVLSTASIDANSGKAVAADNPNPSGTSDVFEPPSFMTLVENENKHQKPVSGKGQQESEASKAGWFPTLTNVSNESEGRKKNEEVITKVTNWSTTGKQSMPLKSLLGDAKPPNVKQPESVVEKDEGVAEKASLPPEAPAANQELSSPPKLIEEGKKGKKVKGRGLWMPFGCCSSVNVN